MCQACPVSLPQKCHDFYITPVSWASNHQALQGITPSFAFVLLSAPFRFNSVSECCCLKFVSSQRHLLAKLLSSDLLAVSCCGSPVTVLKKKELCPLLFLHDPRRCHALCCWCLIFDCNLVRSAFSLRVVFILTTS